MKTVIEAINIFKSFKTGELSVDVLSNISLKIEEGEFCSIMGPSGSGKSTLLYLLSGLDVPDSGIIKINGVSIDSLNDLQKSKMRRNEIGFIFQFYNLIPNLTVEENILLPVLLDNKNVRKYKKTLDEILEIVGLEKRRKYTPRELSGGQQQRVAIARALINEPDIIFADEPIGNLDSKTGVEIMELLQRINKEKNKTIVQVTHSQEAANYGTRLILVKDGRIFEH